MSLPVESLINESIALWNDLKARVKFGNLTQINLNQTVIANEAQKLLDNVKLLAATPEGSSQLRQNKIVKDVIAELNSDSSAVVPVLNKIMSAHAKNQSAVLTEADIAPIKAKSSIPVSVSSPGGITAGGLILLGVVVVGAFALYR